MIIEVLSIGWIVIYILSLLSVYFYKRNLVSKAQAYKDGTSNVEFIFGKPYVIMTEEDYCTYVKTWYECEEPEEENNELDKR